MQSLAHLLPQIISYSWSLSRFAGSPGVPQAQHCQLVEGRDGPAVLLWPHLRHWVQVGAPQYKDMNYQRVSRGGLQKW